MKKSKKKVQAPTEAQGLKIYKYLLLVYHKELEK
jgi:hypothetical protein|nr:MAG TPA: hypothetical protein [Caudoviricetes sp.]